MDLKEAVIKASAGDQQAFAYIFDVFAGPIYRFVRRKIQNEAEAQDLVQDIFLKAWRGLPKLKKENLKFSAWLYRIASNTVNDVFRQRYRSPQILELEEADGFVFAELEGLEGEAEEALKAMRKLPAQYAEILRLRFIEEMDLDETAAILGKTNLAVRVAQHRALARLRKILGAEGPRLGAEGPR